MKIDTKWHASAADSGREVAVTYTAPCCNTTYQINVQAPTPAHPAEIELWCHRDGKGAPATLAQG